MDSVRVNKRGADRIRQGHLWIYRSDVVDVDSKGGAVVSVKDEDLFMQRLQQIYPQIDPVELKTIRK